MNDSARPTLQITRKGRLVCLRDEQGGEALVEMSRAVPMISDWHSVPFEARYTAAEPSLKRRGFTRTILGAMHQMGVSQFSIPLQSLDTQGAMARLIATGEVTAVPGYVGGPSDAEHPVRFLLNPAKARAVTLVPHPTPEPDAALLRGSLRLPELACIPPVAAAPARELCK